MITYHNFWKQHSVSATIDQIKQLIGQLGLEVSEQTRKASNNIYWTHVNIVGTSFFSNGKGVTPQLSMASGYAEIMERLQTQAYYLSSNGKYLNRFHPWLYRDSNFMRQLTRQELDWSDAAVSFLFRRDGTDYTADWLEEEVQFWGEHNVTPDTFKCASFERLSNGQTTWLPLNAVSNIFSTNGMCAGYSKYHALLQGLCEIFERRVNIEVLTKKLVLPTIPDEVLRRFSNYHMIEELKANHGLDIVIKDASLGGKYPVLCIIAKNRQIDKYYVKFGASPLSEIALERCLTELIQGRDMTKMDQWMKSYDESTVDTFTNLLNIIRNGDGYYPLGFLKSDQVYAISYEFVSTVESLEKEFMRYRDELLEQGYDIYIKDWSFLGFDTYQVIIPDFSNIIYDLERFFQWKSEHQTFEQMMLYETEREIDFVLDYIAKSRIDLDRSVQSALFIPMEAHAVSQQVRLGDCLFYGLLKARDYPNALKILRAGHKPSRYKLVNQTLHQAITLLSQGNDINQLNQTLTEMAPPAIVAPIVELIQHPRDINLPDIYRPDNVHPVVHNNYRALKIVSDKIGEYRQ